MLIRQCVGSSYFCVVDLAIQNIWNISPTSRKHPTLQVHTSPRRMLEILFLVFLTHREQIYGLGFSDTKSLSKTSAQKKNPSSNAF